MSMPRPKFCVGEVVDLETTEGVRFTAGYEITNAKYQRRGERQGNWTVTGNSWHYMVAGDPIYDRGNPWWSESQLRKRRDNNWENSVWTPEEVTA